MTRDDQNVVTDGFTTLERGMDSGRDASLIDRNQMGLGVNTSIRGGFATHRPGYKKLAVEFKGTDATRWTQGRWQGAKYFKPLSDSPERIVCSVGGRIFVFVPDQRDGSRSVVQEVTPAPAEATIVLNTFTVPAVGDTINILLASDVWFLSLGEVVVIDEGRYEVMAVARGTLNRMQVTLKNLTGVPGSVVTIGAALTGDLYGDRNNAFRWQVWMEQAEDFMIIQDGEAKPIIYNGSEARRANDDEVPTGTVMAYGLGRLWVARGREFIAGDIAGGPSGTTRYEYRDAVLHFTENDYIAEGGAFLAPAEITAMAFPSNLDTSLGEGELVVFTRTGASTVRVPASRDTWKDLAIPLQRVSLKPFGATGQDNIVEVNGDIWFRSKDGIRSFIMAQRQYGEWGNVPMSREVTVAIEADNERLISNTSGVLFDNRLLMGCVPQMDYERGHYFMGLVALDFDPTSVMNSRMPPAYDGVWTGLNVHQIVYGEFEGISRCFMFVRNPERDLEVWELTRNEIVDRPDEETEKRIEWQVIARSFGFADGADGLKKLTAGRVWRDRLLGEVQMCVEYRPDQFPIWQPWACVTHRAAKEWCPHGECLPGLPLPQYRTNSRLPQLLGPIDEVTDGKPMNQAYEFQTRLTITGSCRLRRFRVKAEAMQEELDYGCPDGDSAEVSLLGCKDTFLGYSSHA